MCGIIGYIDTKNSVDVQLIEKMQEILKHRGPDDKGCHTLTIATSHRDNVNCVLGFVRLSIRDLSQNGHQPMSNEKENITIIFNGEIYNADELRPQLIEKGYKFKSTSDTEVLLYLYEEYGIDRMLSMLDGMYAICIADKRLDKLYLIRDRIGEKPLYIYRKGDLLLFGSEYKAFYCHPQFDPVLNEGRLEEYFMFRYLIGDETLLKGVENLTPGSYLSISKEGIHKTIYWAIPNQLQNDLTFEENKAKFDALLKKSVRRRLVSDVPVGIQLSGGVDSSYISYLASQIYPGTLETFGIIFQDERFSEEKYMDFVNDKFQFSSNKFCFDSKLFLEMWKRSTWHFEAPMNHEGTMGLLLLNHEAKKKVTVLLCGEGSDEGLGGYYRFAQTKYRESHKIETFFKNTARNVISLLKHGHIEQSYNIDDFFISMTQCLSNRCCNYITGRTRKDIKNVYKVRREFLNGISGKGIRKYMNYEVKSYMQDILMRADKVSMAASMEVRVPFIMPELVEYETSIPDEYLVDSSRGKVPYHTKKILKALCCGVFGEEFTYRDKYGFAMPLLEYMKSPEVISFVEDRLLPGIKERKLLSYTHVCELWNNRNNPISFTKSEIQQGLWLALSFELWAQMYLDGNVLTDN